MSTKPSIVNANDGDLISLIEAAKTRVVFVAPGVSTPAAKALRDKWRELGPGAVQVVLDVDPEVCRLGYGTLDGLTSLRDQASALGAIVCHHPGVRIGLLIADETIVVYSPTPLLVEAESRQPDRPNAIQLNTFPTELMNDLGLGENGASERSIGLVAVESEQIQHLERDLKANPPIKFDLARKVNVYRSKFQFVELEMTGIYISRKKVRIPSHLIGLSDENEVQSRFHAHFNLVNQSSFEVKFTEGDHCTILTEKKLHEMRQKIIDDYLISLKGYGRVVLRSNKDELNNRFARLHKCVEVYQRGVTKQLETQMEESITTLVDALLPAVKHSAPR